jgi:hypothetical protein
MGDMQSSGAVNCASDALPATTEEVAGNLALLGKQFCANGSLEWFIFA